VNNTEYTRSIVVVCHATVAASGDGGASRPVRRPADLDTDIERVRERERARLYEERERRSGRTYARARVHTGAIHGRDARDDEDIVSRPFSPPAPRHRYSSDERERESPT